MLLLIKEFTLKFMKDSLLVVIFKVLVELRLVMVVIRLDVLRVIKNMDMLNQSVVRPTQDRWDTYKKVYLKDKSFNKTNKRK